MRKKSHINIHFVIFNVRTVRCQKLGGFLKFAFDK